MISRATCVLAFVLTASVWGARKSVDKKDALHTIGRKTSFVLIGMSGNNALRKGGILSALAELDCGTFESSAEEVKIFGSGSSPGEDIWGKVEANLFKDGGFSDVKNMQSTCTLDEFKSQVQYVKTRSVEDVNAEVQKHDGGSGIRIYMLSIPPKFFASSAADIKKMTPEGVTLRIILEKPFGESLETAKKLQRTLEEVGLKEEEIYRIDHYLGKHMLQALQPFRRFNKPQADAILNGENFEVVRIIQHEARDSAGRGSFLDQTGQVRDMIQSHLLQALALAAMDLPANPSDVHKAKLDVLKQTKVTDDSFFGQYEGFLVEEGVNWNTSRTATTYAHMSFQVWTDRWKGKNGYTDFYIETGKALDAKYAEIRYEAKGGCTLGVRIQGLRPGEASDTSQQRIYVDGKCPQFMHDLLSGDPPLYKPGQLDIHSMDIEKHEKLRSPIPHSQYGGKETLILDYNGYVRSAYGNLLKAAFGGDRFQFLHMDQILYQWSIVDDYIEREPWQVRVYPKCTPDAKLCPDFDAIGKTVHDWMCDHPEKGGCGKLPNGEVEPFEMIMPGPQPGPEE